MMARRLASTLLAIFSTRVGATRVGMLYPVVIVMLMRSLMVMITMDMMMLMMMIMMMITEV